MAGGSVYELNADLEHDTKGTAPTGGDGATLTFTDQDQTIPEAASSDEEESRQRIGDDEGADASFQSSAVHETSQSLPYDDLKPVVEDFSKTTRLITKLPPELRNMIMKTLWESALCPGFVYPHRHLNHDPFYPCEEEPRCAARPTLLSLCKGLLEDYQERFWSENTFVIDSGAPSFSTEFLDWLPAEAPKHIRKVDLTFTIRDLGDIYACCLPPDHLGWEPCRYQSETEYINDFLSLYTWPATGRTDNRSDFLDEASTLGWTDYEVDSCEEADCKDYCKEDEWEDSYCHEKEGDEEEEKEAGDQDNGGIQAEQEDHCTWGSICSSYKNTVSSQDTSANIDIEMSEEEKLQQHNELLTFDLKWMWIDKFYNIHTLPLTELTLDFFECYSLDGSWMGPEIAAALPAFQHGLPEIMRIYAPDLAKRNEIEQIILEKNH
ncbi:MAG: hypothetical protein Q9225_005089 [Loekoesia sp. 1 TL-2023]